MNPKDIRKVLSRDSLVEAEQITGKSYKKDESTVALGLLIQFDASAERAKLMDQLGDSKFSEPLSSYMEIIAAEGFKVVYRANVGCKEEGHEGDDLIIAWHPDGILLCFDTYRKSVNGGKFYYNWKRTDGKAAWEYDHVTSSGGMKGDVWVGDHDCREAIRFNISQLRAHGKFLNPWVSKPFLWLLSYMDTKDKDYDYKAINAKRIALLPDYVQTAIGGQEEN